MSAILLPDHKMRDPNKDEKNALRFQSMSEQFGVLYEIVLAMCLIKGITPEQLVELTKTNIGQNMLVNFDQGMGEAAKQFVDNPNVENLVHFKKHWTTHIKEFFTGRKAKLQVGIKKDEQNN